MHWFCKPGPSRRTHHLHLAPTSGRRYADELAFRDRLRADPDTAEAYAALKRDLAARFADDRDAYTDAKADFIRRTLRRSAVAVPAPQRRPGIDRVAVDVDLEVEVAADACARCRLRRRRRPAGR